MSVTWRVPGRIEVLGKHTDYGGGQVLVCASEQALTVTARPRPGSCEVRARTSLDARELTLTPGKDSGLPTGHWGRYLDTALNRLTSNFGPLAGAAITIESTLPPASGMSSSSALLTGVALCLADLNNLTSRAEWRSAISSRLDLAQYAASIENGKSWGPFAGNPGVGTSGGSLDHTGMLASSQGRLFHAQFDPAAIHASLASPQGYVFAIGVSGVLAEKSGSARDLYNRGPATLGAILTEWNRVSGRDDISLHRAVRALVPVPDSSPLDPRARELDELYACAPDAWSRGRLEQFIRESEAIVPSAAAALENADTATFAELVSESQALAERLLGNQVPETVGLVSLARERGALAASAFGAGFGGSVWALVKEGEADDFLAEWEAAYAAMFPARRGQFLITSPGAAATRL